MPNLAVASSESGFVCFLLAIGLFVLAVKALSKIRWGDPHARERRRREKEFQASVEASRRRVALQEAEKERKRQEAERNRPKPPTREEEFRRELAVIDALDADKDYKEAMRVRAARKYLGL